MYKATGNTYPIKDDLKEVGFNWNKDKRYWEAEEYDAEKWEKRCSPTWHGPQMAAACQKIEIVEI